MSPDLGLLMFFSGLDWGYGIWKEYHGVEVPVSLPRIRVHCIHVTSLAMLTFITWLRQLLPGLSTAKGLFFTFPALFFRSESLSLAHLPG